MRKSDKYVCLFLVLLVVRQFEYMNIPVVVIGKKIYWIMKEKIDWAVVIFIETIKIVVLVI